MKKFKAESQRLLELMINSIYTNKEIFLRELISNASDACDKLHFISLTDAKASKDFEIRIELDEKARTISVSDNGIGMNEKELEENLGTIASSGTFKFKAENKTDEELIGQFGVGFYAAFMVAEKVTVTSRKYGEDTAFVWESSGVDGYTITPSSREECGTTVLLKLKPNSEDDKTDDYLSEWKIAELVKKYSDYIRYPITMMCTSERKKEGTEDEWEEYKELRTLNSRLPIWKRNKNEVKKEDYLSFYRSRYYDPEEPLHYFSASTEGALTYNALIYVPGKAPYDYYSAEYKRGLSLYANGVLIMDKCEDLLPDYFGFLRGVVDSSDLSLNISREMLQKDRQLKALANGIHKRIVSEFTKLLTSDRATYEKLFGEYGASIKFGVYENFGAKKDELKDIILFHSSSGGFTTLKEYVGRMKEEDKEIYYASGKTIEAVSRMPQVEGIRAKGREVLYLTDQIDEFVMRVLGEYEGKKLVPVGSAGEEVKDDNLKDMLSFMTEALGGAVKEVRLNGSIGEYPCCLTSEGEVSLEMERILSAMPTGKDVKATRILELNPTSPVIERAKAMFESDKDGLRKLTTVLYNEALLLAGLELTSAADFVMNLNEFLK